MNKLFAALLSATFALAAGSAFAADDMKKDAMKKDGMMKKDEMKKDGMMKKDEMKKDGMMKKDEMKK